MPAGPTVRAVLSGPRLWGVVTGAAALVVLLTAALIGGVFQPELEPFYTGPVTQWGLPIVRLLFDVAAVVTVGSLLFGVVLAPSRSGELRGTGLRAVHRAAWWAAGWAAASLVLMVLTLSDYLAVPLGAPAYNATNLLGFLTGSPQGQALVVVGGLALVVAVCARWVVRLNAAAVLLVIGFAALLPPALTGHASSAADHDLATSSLVVHIVAVAVWVGGLLALIGYGRRSGEVVRAAAPRFSTLALWSFLAVGMSGAVNAWVRLGGLEPLWTHRYGWLVLGKLLAFGVLGWFGWRHRRRTLRQLASGRPHAFRRLAAGELVLMVSTVALAVALSRSEPPVPEVEPAVWSVAESLVGYDLPPVTWERLVTLWRPDAVVLLLGVFAIGAYLVGVRRMRSRGGWPWPRTVSWLAGVAATMVVLNGGLATYGPVMFSAHMVQHMTLTMLVPILFALGAPVTLALRVLPASRRGGSRGAREWILLVLHSRVARVLTHPVVALTLYVGTLYGFYFSPLFELAMRSHVAHLVMHAHFIAVGSLYFWPIIGLDPMPRRLPHLGRFLLLFASVPFHAFFGVVVMMSDTVIGASWYQTLKLPWVDLADDQYLGGGIAWAVGEIPTLIVLIALVFSWWRADEREGQRLDRRADQGRDTELDEYNAMLARLAEQSSRTDAQERTTDSRPS